MSNYDTPAQYQAEALGKYATGNALAGMGIANRQVVPNLKAQREVMTERIRKIDTLLNLLEKNPEFVQMLDLSRELI